MNINFDAYSINNNPHKDFIKQLLSSTLESINPYFAVKKYLQENPIPTAKRIFAFGLGKAAIAMTQALADEISLTDTIVITKHSIPKQSGADASSSDLKTGSVILGNHPIPSIDSLNAGREAKKFLSQLTKDDLLICLISGGGSALMASSTIALEDLQSLTSALLKNGATIQEINTVRRHLDELKGGGLIRFANGAQILSLILSDVVGDSLETIASGITAPDTTYIQDAITIFEKYKIKNEITTWQETLKPNDSLFENVLNKVIASNQTALKSAYSQIEEMWGEEACQVINQNLQGEASEIGKQIALRFKEELQSRPRPFCLLAGGETTVTVKGNGKGGRNQELALSTVEALAGLKDVMLISIATDGEDGPTDAAGALVTGETFGRSQMLKFSVSNFLLRNDAYHFFEALGDLIKTNPTGTNVNDLVFCFAFK